ncbi:6145_t:CDS:1, partial [Gigaspora rosea]
QLTTDKQQSNECIISDSIEQLFIDKQQNNEHTNSDNFFIINEHSITDRRSNECILDNIVTENRTKELGSI